MAASGKELMKSSIDKVNSGPQDGMVASNWSLPMMVSDEDEETHEECRNNNGNNDNINTLIVTCQVDLLLIKIFSEQQ